MFIKIKTENKKGGIKTGTSIASIINPSTGSILIASDSQITNGHSKMPVLYKKLYSISDNFILGGAGTVSEIQWLIKTISKEIKIKKINSDEEPQIFIDEFSDELQNFLFAHSKNVFSDFNSEFILVGHSKDENKLISVGSDGSIIELDKFYSVGSGSDYCMSQLANLHTSATNQCLKDSQLAHSLKLILSTTADLDLYTNKIIEIFSLNKNGKLTRFVETPIIEEQNQIKKTKPKKDKIENGKRRVNKKN